MAGLQTSDCRLPIAGDLWEECWTVVWLLVWKCWTTIIGDFFWCLRHPRGWNRGHNFGFADDRQKVGRDRGGPVTHRRYLVEEEKVTGHGCSVVLGRETMFFISFPWLLLATVWPVGSSPTVGRWLPDSWVDRWCTGGEDEMWAAINGCWRRDFGEERRKKGFF